MPMQWKCWWSGLLMIAGLASATRAMADEPPLPPLGTPLAQIVDDLAWRSARGEPEAACRLAMELAVCAVDLHRSWLLCKDREGNPTVCKGHYGHVSPHDQQVDWPRYVADLETQCDGAPIIMPRELLARFRRAAFLGSATAMGFYMSAPRWMDPGGWNSRVPSIWPAESSEARAVEQHYPTLAWALFHAGYGSIASKLANMRYDQVIGEMMDAEATDDDQRPHHVEAMALMHYDIAVRHALGRGGDGEARESNPHANSLEVLATDMSAEHIEQAQAMARHWRETITLRPGQGPEADLVRRNVDGTHYGGIFAPSDIARCDQVVPVP